jgi:hypothetical protein
MIHPLSLILALLVLAPSFASAEDEAAWTKARAAIAEGMFMESGLGDFSGACKAYERGLAVEGLEPELEAELLIRLAAGREMLGDLDTASEILEQLLARHATVQPWAELAHLRLLRLAEHGRRIPALPLVMGFDAGTEAWLHAGRHGSRGSLAWADELGHESPGVMVWQSQVLTQARSDVYLCFSSPSPVLNRVELWVTAVDFPAHLILFLVEEGGSRFASGHYVIEPSAGWVHIRSDLDDFFLFPGEDVTRHPDPRKVEFLILEDATATYSTDRGMNRVIVDDVRLE